MCNIVHLEKLVSRRFHILIDVMPLVAVDDLQSLTSQYLSLSNTIADCPQGMICFPDITACDARNIVPDTYRPTREITPAPTLTMPPMGGPTPIPTDMPIGPPDPLPFPSDDPTDHWFWCVAFHDSLICSPAKHFSLTSSVLSAL